MTKYSLVMIPTPCRVYIYIYLLCLRIHAHVDLFTYTVGSVPVKPAITEKFEDRAKVAINGLSLYKIVHGMPPKCMTLNDL